MANVRRLLALLRRLALLHGADYVFEPNDAAFRRRIERGFEAILGLLFERGAFAGAPRRRGATGSRSATRRTRPQSVDAGRLIVELQVAPSVPLEFLTVRLVRSGDRLTVEVRLMGNPADDRVGTRSRRSTSPSRSASPASARRPVQRRVRRVRRARDDDGRQDDQGGRQQRDADPAAGHARPTGRSRSSAGMTASFDLWDWFGARRARPVDPRGRRGRRCSRPTESTERARFVLGRLPARRSSRRRR